MQSKGDLDFDANGDWDAVSCGGLNFHVTMRKIDNLEQRPTQSWDITPERVMSFGMGSLSKRRSFPSRHGGRNPVRRQRISEGLPSGFAFAGMTAACNAHVSQMAPLPLSAQGCGFRLFGLKWRINKGKLRRLPTRVSINDAARKNTEPFYSGDAL
jgi:hypothetical protein